MNLPGSLSSLPKNSTAGTLAALASALLLAGAGRLPAAEKTWTGNTDGNWADGGNWSPSAPAATGDNLVFGAAGTLAGQTVTGVTSVSLATPVGLLFNASASAYTIGTVGGGATFTLTGGGITNASTNLQTLNVDIATNGTQRTFSTTAGGGDITVGGVISGGGGISKINGGVLTLSNANTYSGVTSLSGGGLMLGNDSALGSSVFSFGSGTLSASAGRTIGNAVNLAGTSVLAGSNSIELSGTLTGSTGNRILNNNLSAGTATISGPVFLSESATGRVQTFGGSGTTVISGKISNSNGFGATTGQIIKNGTGVLSLTNGASDYTGLSVSEGGVTRTSSILVTGTVGVGADATGTAGNVTAGPLGTGMVDLRAGFLQAEGGARTILNHLITGNTGPNGVSGTNALTIAGNFTTAGSQVFNVTNAALTTISGTVILRSDTSSAQRTLTLGGTGETVISGAIVNGSSLNGILAFNNTSANGITLSGNNSYSGATTVGAGALVKLGNANALGFGGASAVSGNTSVASGATLDLNGQTGIYEAITINGNGVSGNGVLINSSVSTGAVLNNGLAAVGFGVGGAGYTDGVHALTITGGGGSGAAANATVVGGAVVSVQVISTGSGYTGNPTLTLTSAGTPTTAATLNSAISSVAMGSASSIGGAGNLTINAPVTGAFPLTKVGAGKVTLNGVNTFSGTTTVSAGTLLINGSSVSSTVVNGGVLGGSGTITNQVAIGNGGTLAPGNSAGVLNITGNLSLTGTASTIAMEIAGAGAGQYDQIAVNGTVNLGVGGNGKIEMTLLSYAPGATDIFFLVLNDGTDAITGNLYGLNQGDTFSSGGYTWTVSYTGNSATNSFAGSGNDLAVMAVIPEPGTIGLLTAAAALLVRARRKRQAC